MCEHLGRFARPTEVEGFETEEEANHFWETLAALLAFLAEHNEFIDEILIVI
jgi:hypothetical protein